ncbi:SpoIIE family protein phosphatase [Streptomyces sudanensis]|uniref:SpoIIE family protein phosphatase n=1 Tax=Streptomyces sudanensis TaxID=436397 RepID=UPI0020CBE39C|nr:SpoIIE family protein phosphatase [Streptomyces sudanensis]MCP9985605.1 SpoIIE family protein phosphatase [Streptomyces sudanensis]
MNHGLPLLLVDVPRQTARAIASELAATAEIIQSTVEDVSAYTGGTPGRRRPTVVVLGEAVAAPIGVVHFLRPHPEDLAVVLTAAPARDEELAVLPLLFSSDVVRRVEAGETAERTPCVVSELLRRLTRRRAHTAAQAAAQQRLSSGTSIDRQLGEQLLGQFLAQAPIGVLMLDGDAMIAWNQRAADILELTEPDSVRRPVTDLFPEDQRTALHHHLTTPRPLRDAEPDAVFERVRGDGTSQALHVAVRQVLDHKGLSHTLVLTEDVTDRLHAQRKLAERTGHALLTAEVAAAMTAAGPLDERLHRCVRATADRLGADRVCIWTLNTRDELAHAICTEGETESSGPSMCQTTQRTLVEQVVATRRPYLDISPRTDPCACPLADGRGSFTGFPLVSGGELLGVLSLTTHLALPGSVLATLENIADQIAVGTQQDRLLNRLSEATRALERPLLPPRLPNLPGFDLAARYTPFSQGLHIGGDFYDAFTAPDARHVLVLGDVCGKGPDAAAITGLVRHTLWAAAQQTSDPTHVLSLVNNALRRQKTPFCTLVYVVIDTTHTPARLRIASAGHPAPLLRRANGDTAPLETQGALLGVLETPHHPVTEVELRPGDTLVLYTDGFTEGAGAVNQRVPEDLTAVLAALPPAGTAGSAESVAAALMDDAHRWWGEQLRDDLAVLALTALTDAHDPFGDGADTSTG